MQADLRKLRYFALDMDGTIYLGQTLLPCHLVREGVPFIATHPDINCPVDIRSGYIPDVGSMLAMIHTSTGRRARCIGKPNREMAEALMNRLGGAREETAMVGDRLYTDIQMAVNAGLCGILVLSGETRQVDLVGSAGLCV